MYKVAQTVCLIAGIFKKLLRFICVILALAGKVNKQKKGGQFYLFLFYRNYANWFKRFENLIHQNNLTFCATV